MLTAFLAIVIAIVVVFLAQIVLDIRSELKEVKTALTTAQMETARRVGVEPFSILEKRCVKCHSERRFLGVHASSFELKKIIDKMEKMPGARISVQERDRIHSALALLKCVHCHEEDEGLKKLEAMAPERQHEVVRRMKEKPEAKILPEEAKEILRAYREIQGF